jgi:cytochrome P450
MSSSLRYDTLPRSKVSTVPDRFHLGDAFRFRPNGVLFMSPKAYNGIYGAKGNNVKKSEFYTSMQRSKHFNSTITSTDKAIHAKKRKVLNSVFSDKTVQSAEAFIIKHVDKWCEAAGEQLTAWTGAKNVSPLVDFLTFDIMGDLAFGVEFRTQEPGENPMKAIPGTIHSFLKRLNMVCFPYRS